MLLTLSEEGCNLPGGCSGQRYASGEYQSDQTYQYGTYTVRMRAAKGCGLVTGFFVFHAKWDQKGNVLEWDEIDVEILGKNTKQIYTNWITDVAGVDANQQPIRVRKNHEAPPVTLPFDAAEGFYDYIFQWQPDSIKWYVRHTNSNGQAVTTLIREVFQSQEADTLPKRPGKIIMNFWATCNSWAGCEGPIDPSTGKPDPNPVCFSGEGPVSVAFDHVSYSP